MDDRKPRSSTLHDRLAGHPPKPIGVAPGSIVVPPHHGSLGPERSDVVDTELDQLLDHEFGAPSLDERERDAEPRLRCSDPVEFSTRPRAVVPAARTPAPLAVADGEGIALAEAKHPFEVMTVVVGEHG